MANFLTSLDVDMMALEAAVGAYDAVNDLDRSYLSSDESRDEYNDYASESASDDFGFGMSLFDDEPAFEAAEGDAAPAPAEKVSFGTKLKNGIKNILASIGKFFAKIGNGIKEFFTKLTAKKKAAEGAPIPAAVPETTLQKVESAVGALRGLVQKAIDICNADLLKASTETEKLCVKINKAIGDANIRPNSRATGDTLSAMGHEFTGTEKKGSTEKLDGANSAVETATTDVESLEKAAGDLKDLIGQMESVSVECAKKIMTIIASTEFERETSSRRGSLEDNDAYKKRTDAEEKARKEEYNEYNAGKDKKDKIEKYKKGADLNVTVAEKLLKKSYFSEASMFSKVEKAVQRSVDTCKKNQAFCQSAAGLAERVTDDNPHAKLAYNLCKVYVRASAVFNDLNKYIQIIASGSFMRKAGGSETVDITNK